MVGHSKLRPTLLDPWTKDTRIYQFTIHKVESEDAMLAAILNFGTKPTLLALTLRGMWVDPS
jgi:hypothetical protein